MDLFLRNISQLVTVAGESLRDLGILTDAGVLCRDGKIAWVGKMSEWKGKLDPDTPELDASGKVVLPGFVDAHTHALFAGSREGEFALRASGATYQEIGRQGGGILSTMREVRQADKKTLKKRTARYLTEMLRHGTTTVEIKSGYGLSPESETKMLEAINELKQEELIGIVPTFLGAHAVPPEFAGKKPAYVDLVVDTMIPYTGKKKLAAFCDVFVDEGYFDIQDAERILKAGASHGMRPKLHADELGPSGGAELAARVKAVSADHLEHVSEDGITALKSSGVTAVLLPGVSFTLGHGYAPARKLIDAGVAVALASDFNPGSCMSFSMPLMMTIACTQMHMTPEEAITATTLHGAAALGIADRVGSIENGKDADLIVADVPDYRFLAYHFGVNHIGTTIKHGTILEI